MDAVGASTLSRTQIPMRLQRISIKNFRLLKNVELILDETTTVIVGRNNSGKTSLAEIFRRILADKVRFELEDFSLGTHEGFWTAFVAHTKHNDEDKLRELIPRIEVNLTIGYEKEAPSLGPLSDFIVDLNPACAEVLVNFRYELALGSIKTFFSEIKIDTVKNPSDQRAAFFRTIRSRITGQFTATIFAVDPNDATNQKSIESAQLKSLLRGGFINAQRGLDDKTDRENDVLGKILEILFKSAKSTNASPEDQQTAQKLETAVQDVQTEIDADFSYQLNGLLPAFRLFGYPRLPDPQLRTETLLDVERLLSNHTKVRYSGLNGIHLPEAYNGLGTRNLIFILLKLLEFFKAYQTAGASGINLVFIEEPEAHLHPQMQEVFINKLSEVATVFSNKYNNGKAWPVQFIVSTHSSHVANKAPFCSMRYFLAVPEDSQTICYTKVKDLGRGFSGNLKDDESFLQQYMTLTRCDLLFADKAILVEGTSERLLFPKFVGQIDKDLALEAKLSSQYVCLMEVGGAYAHRFFKLLEFLEVQTLVITDLDSVDSTKEHSACLVSEADSTSNGCIKDWFEKIPFADIVKKKSNDKITGKRRIAFQIPESDKMPTGRSFEEAFVLANEKTFGITGKTPKEKEQSASDKAKALGKKSEFALKYAIEESAWTVPRYIKEGLLWLVEEEIAKAASDATIAAQKSPKLSKSSNSAIATNKARR
jgi:predicted ATP-dependent endonuclease of OLD family